MPLNEITRNETITRLYKRGFTPAQIAKQFTLSEGRVCQIVRLDAPAESKTGRRAPRPQVQQHNPGDVYRYIVNHCATHRGAPPTFRDIAAGCGIASTNTVSEIVQALVKAGKLEIINRRIAVVGAVWHAPE